MASEILNFFHGDELAASVWEKKYKFGNEKTPADSFLRYCKEIAKKEIERTNTITLYQEIDSALSDYGKQRWYNVKQITTCGNPHSRREMMNEHFQNYINFDNIILGGSMLATIGNHKSYSSLSNCFVLGQPYDSYAGINQKSMEMCEVMKRRMGAGIDISTLRPDGAAVHNQSTESCGPVLFAERYSFISSEIAQRGRRGALMISINIAHPNALDFIQSKQDLTKITGANISVIVNNEFMNKVIDKKDNYYIQHFPCNVPIESFDLTDIHVEDYSDLIETTYEKDGKIHTGYVRIVNAKEIWNKIIHCAWATAEPGIIFGDNWFDGGTDGVYDRYAAITCNPCSEIPMQAYDSCRLASINLFGFVKNPFTSNAEFDFDRFYKVAYEQVCILDNLVDLEADYINRIIDKINSDTNEPEELREQSITLWKRILNEGKSGRRLGAGFTALGDTLAALGLNYSIDINTEYFLNKLFECKMSAELDASIDLAILFGTFEGFDVYKEFDKSLTSGKNRIFQTILEHFPEQAKRMQLYGRRNVSWSTAAPTGSLSILTQTTSGVEPLFLPWYERRKKVTSHTERVDYIDPADGNKFTVFFVLHPKFKLWLEMQGINPDNLSKTQLQKLFEQSPWYGSCANDIDWESRVTIQSIVQKYTTHAISSTINLPSDIDEQTISNIYLKSWSSGLKGNTVYRDGSRGGVIVSTDKKQQSDNEFTENRAPKRPKELKAYYHTLQSKGTVYAVIIGLLENKPYEVFITSGLDNLPVNLDEFEDKIEGEIVKEYKNRYDFVCDGFILRDLADVELDEKMVSLMISMGLRHRTPLKFVIKTLEKMQPIAGSFTHRLIKILSKYIPNGEEYVGDKCPDCGDTLRYENGCCICPSCGYTKC